MQSAREQQGEIRKPFKMNNAKKQREKNRTGKIRDLFNNIGDTNNIGDAIFHAKMGTIKTEMIWT